MEKSLIWRRCAEWRQHESFQRGLKLLGWVLAIWMVSKYTIGFSGIIPGPWGPTVVGKLPTGESVWFRSRFIGRETDDWIGVDDKMYAVNDYRMQHFSYVRIVCDESYRRIWIESNSSVIASLDLSDDDFTNADTPPPVWARLGTGITISRGYTRSVVQYIVPW